MNTTDLFKKIKLAYEKKSFRRTHTSPALVFPRRSGTWREGWKSYLHFLLSIMLLLKMMK